MRTMRDAFVIALFIAIAMLGVIGDSVYTALSMMPAKAFQLAFVAFFIMWLLAIAGKMLWSSSEDLWFRFRVKPASDGADAVLQLMNARTAFVEQMKKCCREWSDTASQPPSSRPEGGQQ